MPTRTAPYFDKMHWFQDVDGACGKLRQIIEERHPTAVSLLDVACGTGRHLERLAHHYDVEGLDIDPAFIDVARKKLPTVSFHVADMTNFSLTRSFDVVTCLFSSIAYAQTIDRLGQTVLQMRRHLKPAGLLLVEPWFSPANYWENKVFANFVDEPDLKISWMYVSERQGNISVLDYHITIGKPDGVEHFQERHNVGLFTHREYIEAFQQAGLQVEYDPVGLFKRGLYIGRAEG